MSAPAAPLPWDAATALARLQFAFADQVVANFDNHGSLWGFDTVESAEADIAMERFTGSTVDEWETTDRDGRPLRVVRMSGPSFLDAVCVFGVWGREMWGAA